MRIETTYENGVFGFREVPPDYFSAVEVPDSTVEMWRAVIASSNVMQSQLCQIDNELWEKYRNANK